VPSTTDPPHGEMEQPSPSPSSTSGTRLFFIDNLRIVLISLVVLWHVAVTYGASGTWPYQEVQGDDLTSIVFIFLYAANGPYVLGFFFLISGYFASGSYDRKGSWFFIRDWVRRLGFPIILYVLIFDPLITFGIKSVILGFQESFFDYFPQHFRDYRTLGIGPMWFIEGLLVILILYALTRLVLNPGTVVSSKEINPVSNKAIIIFAVSVGVFTFLLRIWIPVGWLLIPLGLPLALFPQFIALFIVGITAYRGNWFLEITDTMGKRWLTIALIFIFIVFPGGLHWQSLVFAIWEQVVCVGMIIGLLIWFRGRFNQQGSLAKALSESAFTVYFIHAPILVYLALALRNIELYPLLKFALIAPIAIFLCFVTAYFLRKVPLVKRIV
jgi:surface polysaccharide O-acyltransferase-like enzyme